LFRLIYKSRSSRRIDRETVRGILRTSAELNRKNRITGVLLATPSHFLQVIEGGFEEVNSTFMRIVDDPRHEEIRLIAFGPAEDWLFEGWVMRGFGVFGENPGLEAELKGKYGEEDGGVRFPERSWRALALVHDIRMVDNIPDLS
jgi:hypothetical protein